MKDLRKMFITKDFVINSNVLKSISSLDITLDEFLIILYFINVSLDLDIENMKSKLGLDENRISIAFNNLISKKYIDMNVKNENGKVIESISLNPFYDRLVVNEKEESNASNDIYALYESELGRTLSSFEYEIINGWKEKNISEDIIKGALKEAILNGVTNFKYIDKIVFEWSKKGIKKKVNDQDNNEYFDYNWLDNNE